MQDQDQPIAAGQPAKDDGILSESDVIRSLTEAAADSEEQPEEPSDELEDTEEEETEAEDAEDTEAEETEDEEETEPSDELELDLDSLTPEQIQELAGKARSKALARYGKLTAKIRDLEGKLEAQANKQPEPDPFKRETKVTNPQIAAIESLEDLTKWRDEAEETEEWAQNLLDTYGNADAEDVIATVKGQNYTKAQILSIRNGAKKALKNDIPARFGELKELTEVAAIKEHNAAQVAVQVPEAVEEGSQVKATYDELKTHPFLKGALKDPKAAAVADLVLAHAARSMVQTLAKKKPAIVANPAGKAPKAKPPGTPNGGGAPRPAFKANVKGKELAKQEADFDGDPEALVRLITARES